jgi:hypothetical protein
MSSLEQRQAELQSRLASIDAEISKLDDEFTALAASFSGTDSQSALRAAEQIERKLMELRREKSVVILAQGHTTRAQLAEKEAQADKDRRALQAERQQHVDALAALSAECDDFMTRIRGLLERRQNHIHSLGMLGANPAILAKLGKPALTRSACYHGLAKFFALERVASASLLPLSSTQTLVAGLGKEATAAPLSSSPLSEVGMVEPPGIVPTPTNGSGEDDSSGVDHPTNGGEPQRRRQWGIAND